MADLIWVQWYATIFRKDVFAQAVAEVEYDVAVHGALAHGLHLATKLIARTGSHSDRPE